MAVARADRAARSSAVYTRVVFSRFRCSEAAALRSALLNSGLSFSSRMRSANAAFVAASVRFLWCAFAWCAGSAFSFRMRSPAAFRRPSDCGILWLKKLLLPIPPSEQLNNVPAPVSSRPYLAIVATSAAKLSSSVSNNPTNSTHGRRRTPHNSTTSAESLEFLSFFLFHVQARPSMPFPT